MDINLLQLKLSETKIITESMADLAKQIFECLNPNMDLMEFSQIVVHQLLINHGFTQQLPNENQPNTYNYTSCYRPEFLYIVTFQLITNTNTILFQMARVLNDDSQSVSYVIREKPVFEGDSTINDRYIIEKLLVNLIKKFSKLWTNFREATETPTPDNADVADNGLEQLLNINDFLVP